MNERDENTVRPLAFQLARELKDSEVDSISGGIGHYTWNERYRMYVFDAHH